MVGANQSGKSILLSNFICNDMFPWWYCYFFPPRGLFLTGNQRYPTINEWLRAQISTTVKGDPWSAMSKLLSKRRNEQRVRLFLHKVFKTKLPRLLKPQQTSTLDLARILICAIKPILIIKANKPNLLKY